MTINYGSNVLHIADLKARLAELTKRHKYGQPEEDADFAIWDEWKELEYLQEAEAFLSWCWHEDATALIHEDYWQRYCEEFCYDIGELQRGGIVASYTDWERIADAMSVDYRQVILPDGNDFYVRS